MSDTGKIIAELIKAAKADNSVYESKMGLVHTAADNALLIEDLRGERSVLALAWRFIVLQTLDDYESTYRRGGADLAKQVFAKEPPATGYTAIDTALAALADWFATRDGWDPEPWVNDPARTVLCWFPDLLELDRREALIDSPPAFKKRGIFITRRGLSRA